VEFHCGDCVNDCDVMLLLKDAEPVACLRARCGKWSEDPRAAGERGCRTGCEQPVPHEGRKVAHEDCEGCEG